MLDHVMVIIGLAILAFTVWFFGFAGSTRCPNSRRPGAAQNPRRARDRPRRRRRPTPAASSRDRGQLVALDGSVIETPRGTRGCGSRRSTGASAS
jgi:hypothetical protein